jgi:catechol 2,3-dioxygenase-like lactoylglutathione lyase family enzyme
MSVQVYGCNHIAIEVDDIEKAIAFYKDVFNLEQMSGGEGDAFFKLGAHQFLAVFEVEKVQPAICATSGSWSATKRNWRKSATN